MREMPPKTPLVTVGIPTFNRPEGLRRTLECITGQTYKNLEIIVSDNASPSNAPEDIVRGFMAGDPRVSYFRQQDNIGWRNFFFLLDKAAGKYFMWASDDDWWDPRFIEEIVARLTAEPGAVMGFSNYEEANEDGSRRPGYPEHLPLLNEFVHRDPVLRVGNFIRQYEGLGKGNLVYALFDTAVLRSIDAPAVPEGCLAGDVLIGLKMLLRGGFVVAPEVLRKTTVGNPKTYQEVKPKDELLNLIFIVFNYGGFKSLHRRWGRYLLVHFLLVAHSDLPLAGKLRLLGVVLMRVLNFYWDVVCVTVQIKRTSLFYSLKRKSVLE